MSRLRPFRARVGAVGAASLAALSLLVTSLTPLALRASAADESVQSPKVTSSQDVAQSSSLSEEGAAEQENRQADAPASSDENVAEVAASDEENPEDKPRVRRTRAVAEDHATLALNVVNDAETLRIHDDQITTINFSCSSVTTPCKQAEIELTLPGPITPAGLKLIERGYTVVPVTGNSVDQDDDLDREVPGRHARAALHLQAEGSAARRHVRPYPGHLALRLLRRAEQLDDHPERCASAATNAETVEQTLTTTWTADHRRRHREDAAPRTRRTTPRSVARRPTSCATATSRSTRTNPNKVGIRWNGSSMKSGTLNGLGFVGVQNIKVVDPLPAQAVFVTASDGGVYDPATHTVTWSYDKWLWQNPIESTVTVKYPEGTVTLDDTVTNKATITAEVMNDPTTIVSKSSEITHGFAERKVGGRIMKTGNDFQYQVRGGLYPWRFAGINSGNTTLHFRWEDTLPCTWSTQDAKAAGDSCDQPTMVGPYRFNIFTKSGYEDNGGWTLEYWTNKGNHETVNYTKTTGLTLPDGEWITRFIIDTDAAPQTSPQAWLHGTVSREPPDDGARGLRVALQPGAAAGEVLQLRGLPGLRALPELCDRHGDRQGHRHRRRLEATSSAPGCACATSSRASRSISPLAPTPWSWASPPASSSTAPPRRRPTVAPPLPSRSSTCCPRALTWTTPRRSCPRSAPTLKNPDGTPYDLSKVTVEIEKNFNGHGSHPDPLERSGPGRGQPLLDLQRQRACDRSAGQNTNDAMAFMPGDGAKATNEDKSLRNTNYCIGSRAVDTFDVNKNGSTTDYVCNAATNFNVATTPSMNIAKEVKGNKNADFVPAGEIAEIDPGADGAYRFTIANSGNTPLTNVVAYDVLPHLNDVGVGPASSQARGSHWKPNLNSTTWAFQSVKEKPGRDPEITAVPASDITVQYSTVPNPCRGEVLSAGGAMNDAPAGCTPDAWGDAPADLTTITGFRHRHEP